MLYYSSHSVRRQLREGNRWAWLKGLSRSLVSPTSVIAVPEEDGGEFKVSPQRGFLPLHDPLSELPKRFAKLEHLLQEMPIKRSDGQPGLLARGQLGDATREIPEYEVMDIDDIRVLHALFRDYTFWASAYLLEPCHQYLVKHGDGYGLGRNVLPQNIAIPLCKLAARLGMRPFMEYATSYALYNWRRINSRGPITIDNLRLIRAFTGHPSEAGFILVHVAMVAHSSAQVRATLRILHACQERNHTKLARAMEAYLRAMQAINRQMETMWTLSRPDDYKMFRTFIMGLKNQPMFPEGVTYQSVPSEDGKERRYRGESGANDSIIPSADNLFQITEIMPNNPLTEILRDFRTYRPVGHKTWLAWLENAARELHVRQTCLESGPTAVLLLECLDQVREFRQRHWDFAREYILRHTNHPVATGGSPILTWLPNQLTTVLRLMQETNDEIRERSSTRAASERNVLRLGKYWQVRREAVERRMTSQEHVLERQVSQLVQEREHEGREEY